MAKKTTKKPIKVMTVMTPRTETPDAVETIIGSLASLQASQGWALIIKILNDNIAYLEKAILEKIDPLTKEALNDAEIEVFRTKRGLNIELRDTPASYSKVVKDMGEVPIDYDPYWRTNEEMIRARMTSNQDDKGSK